MEPIAYNLGRVLDLITGLRIPGSAPLPWSLTRQGAAAQAPLSSSPSSTFPVISEEKSGVRLQLFNLQTTVQIPVSPCIPSLSLSFLIYEMGIIIVHIL